MKENYIKILLDSKDYIQRQYGVVSLRIFGSQARNEANESSDVDVCVEMPADMFKRYALKDYLEQQLHCSVDVVRLRQNMNALLHSEIERDGIRIF